MGGFGTYCGTAEVMWASQVVFDQLEYLKDAGISDFQDWIEGTLIPSAERFIDGYCNHAFGTPGLGTITLDGSGKRTLFVPPHFTPMVGITAGSIDSGAIDISQLAVYDQYLRYVSSFRSGRKNVILSGSYGYLNHLKTEFIVPADVQYVCAQLVANLLLDTVRRNMAPDLFQAFMSGGGGGDLRSLWAQPAIFTKPLKERLDPYRILWVDVG